MEGPMTGFSGAVWDYRPNRAGEFTYDMQTTYSKMTEKRPM